VTTASNGLEGLKQILENRPDLIVMDIWMPIGMGFSVAERFTGWLVRHSDSIYHRQ